jgi:branched-subunit amino acid aminotransferase/4-amino-4-deoxychorismate lyase
MSNFSDFPKIGDSEKNRPIMRVEEDLRRIKSSLNTLLIDTQSLKSDIAEIKEILKEKEQSREDE